ncbi:MAG: ribokinase, partial [Clostridia bacterium]|nr:ribokinase [Clostridia bacterium]
MSDIYVIGSMNMDMTVVASRFPELGETVNGQSFSTAYGGKGANQAVAAARLGANVKICA